MSSRTPAPDDFERFPMPDLPGDLYEDDTALYASNESADFGDDSDYGAWEDDYPDVYGDVDDVVDERPRRRSRSSIDDEPGIGGRRRSMDDDSIERPKRKPRRIPRDQMYEEPRSRTRPSRPSRRQDDDYLESSRMEGSVSNVFQEIGRPVTRRRVTDDVPQQRLPSRSDRVLEQPRMQMSAATADIVTNVRPAAKPIAMRPRKRRPRNPAWEWRAIVMPQPRQMLEQALPSLVMAISVIGTLAIMNMLPRSLSLWAPMILLPSLVLLLRADHDRHPMWARAALINLVVAGAFFPMMIVRQSFLRVPFVEFGNGTLVMPILSTLVVVVAMAGIALGSAVLSQEDPEYAGMLFLPAAMIVPFFAGATEITGLATALTILAVIYVAVGVLTVVASMLPAAFPTLVAPVALALEFFVLPVSESAPIFPVGAGMSAKLLFFVVLAFSVGLTVAVPMMAVWVRRVRRLVQGRSGSTRLAAA